VDARRAAALGNGYGGLTAAGDYAVDVAGERVPPAPWANIIANPAIGCCVTERGGGFSWAENSYFFRLTPWSNDPVSDPCGEVIYLRDVKTGETWSPTPGPNPAAGRPSQSPRYEVTHAPGVTRFSHTRGGIATELTLGVPRADAAKISHLRLVNQGATPRHLSLTSYVEWVLGAQREHTRHQLHTRFDATSGAIFAQNVFAPDFTNRVGFSWISERVTSHTARRDHFIGRNGDLVSPAGVTALQLSGATGAGYDPCAALRCSITLDPGETRDVVLLLGAAGSDDAARGLIGRYGSPAAAEDAIREAAEAWNTRLSVVTARTPDAEFDALMNRWSLYQALSCRMWARSALYQSSGAFGFRDQLQDAMAFVYADPEVAREHIIRSASRQFVEGDVQHWWHPQSGRGVRTKFSDDLVWLPFVIDHYVNVACDQGIFDVEVPYLTMRELNPDEHEIYELPKVSDEKGTIYDHCLRALRKASTTGVHGLPLIGSGDWNDGMNRVGIEGKGESVWLGWFLITTLRRFAMHADHRGDAPVRDEMLAKADAYAEAIDRTAWDGEWYRRAYFDDGSPLGSRTSDECKIDSIAQSWSVISGAAPPDRVKMAMESLNKYLVREDARLIMLLTPPFDKTTHDPGYIQGYLPGVRE